MHINISVVISFWGRCPTYRWGYPPTSHWGGTPIPRWGEYPSSHWGIHPNGKVCLFYNRTVIIVVIERSSIGGFQ